MVGGIEKKTDLNPEKRRVGKDEKCSRGIIGRHEKLEERQKK